MQKILTRIILILVIAEVAYLSLVNLALNLPLTQSLINQQRPEKYAVHWERAWSWYPLQVSATGISANGQTSSQQWQADAASATATVALSPLFQRTVQVSGVDVQDIAFRLRPRPEPEKNYGAIREFFPPIRDRDPDSPAIEPTPGKEGKKAWKIVVDGIRAHGSHDVWVFQVRGAMDGVLGANLSFETRGGPFSLGGGNADLALSSLTIDRDWEVSSDGSLKGRFDLALFVPADNPGLKALGFLTVDADLDAPVNSLGFLNYYLQEFNGIKVDGKGRLRGHLRYEKGDLMSGTDMVVVANELALAAPPYEVGGAGTIDIVAGPEDTGLLSIGIQFGDLRAMHEGDEVPLFTGAGLVLVARGSSQILPDEARQAGNGSLSVQIPSVEVPDLRLYQRYLPESWDVEIMGGQGSLQGHAEYTPSEMRSSLKLTSDEAELQVKDFHFATDLDLELKVRGGAAEAASVDLSGTYLRLDGARLTSTKEGESEPWTAAFTIAKGTLSIPVPDSGNGESGFRHLSGVFKDKGFRNLLSSADADLAADFSVSDLGWVNLLFKNPFDLAISGSGEIAADLKVRGGSIAEETALTVQPKELQIQVLDYVAQGEGTVTLAVQKGGARPDMRLDARLDDAGLKRRGEKDAVVQKVTLELSALATNVGLDGGGDVAALELRIPSARVKDMSVYNQYLPKDSPLKLLGGEADLTADVHLEPKSAGGFVKLKTSGLKTRLDEQEVAGELTLDIKLNDGVPSDMDFDISGSSLLLDRVKVAGGQKSFDGTDWSARFDLNKAHVVWKKPIRLDVKAGVQMKDSRPIVAMFANQRGKEGWLNKVLTVTDIRGKAELKIARERALVPFALVGSDKIDVGAKGLVDATGREGIFYARFRKLQGIVKVKDGEKNFDILGARKTFDAYAPGETPLKLTGSQPESENRPTEPDRKKTGKRTGWIWGNRGAEPDAAKGSYENFMGE